jgi:predicted metal-binding membrane protein
VTQATVAPARPRWTAGLPWALAGLVLFAWAALALWGASPYARYLGHGNRYDGPAAEAAGLALFLVGWALMVAAMMLPTATRLLRSFELVVQRRADRRRLEALVAAGFLGTWVLVGYGFQVFDLGVHAAVGAIGWLDARPQLIGASALLAAGGFQFTSLKHRCLTACRSPRGFIYRNWRGGRPGSDALRIGVTYGTSCVGCCWALMLMLFALGTSSLVWMLAVGALMAAEKNSAAGERLARPVGAALIAAGTVVALA